MQQLGPRPPELAASCAFTGSETDDRPYAGLRVGRRARRLVAAATVVAACGVAATLRFGDSGGYCGAPGLALRSLSTSAVADFGATMARRVVRGPSLGRSAADATGSETEAALLGLLPLRPDWVRLRTSAHSAEATRHVSAAVAAVSEELRDEGLVIAMVRGIYRDGGELREREEWAMSVAVPSRAILLLSSMIAEAHDEVKGTGGGCGNAEPPMLLAEGLDADGDPQYLRGELCAVDTEAATAFARDAVAQGLAACAQVDSLRGSVSLLTTAAGRDALMEGAGRKLVWTPVGGSPDYLAWVQQQIEVTG